MILQRVSASSRFILTILLDDLVVIKHYGQIVRRPYFFSWIDLYPLSSPRSREILASMLFVMRLKVGVRLWT